jgi:hypothetical protein
MFLGIILRRLGISYGKNRISAIYGLLYFFVTFVIFISYMLYTGRGSAPIYLLLSLGIGIAMGLAYRIKIEVYKLMR